ncbi:MAG: DUF4336 domain-containing protein [Cyanobacteria bacterium Co-bin8]|nr:DUF4336 domain-containing protein [Cyanobacteria bacterium Co-bin8]
MSSSTERFQSIIRSKDWAWPFWPVLPLYPYGQRRTLRHEIVKDTIWTFDQVQGIFYVIVPIRMTVVRLERGGLLVYAPVAPTPECLRLMRELEARYGEVKYIILPTVSGIEHKVFVGPFARCFPKAQVFVAPEQWSFPVNLPLNWLGLPADRTQILPAESSRSPFGDQFDYAILGPLGLGLGPFVEVAFFHRSTRSLLVTDSVVSISEDPPPVLLQDPFPLLFHAKDSALEVPQDTPDNRRRGWQRICLFGFYFRPSALDVEKPGKLFREAFNAPDRSRRNFFGLYPFRWQPDWQLAFETLRGRGRLLVAPVLQTLIFPRGPKEVIAWADWVAAWQFERIIPCHMDAPISAGPKEFRQAFSFLERHPPEEALTNGHRPLPPEDFELLRQLESVLVKGKVTPPAQEKV